MRDEGFGGRDEGFGGRNLRFEGRNQAFRSFCNPLLHRHHRSHARLRVVIPFHSVGDGGQFGEEAFGDELLQTGRRLAARGFVLVDGAVHLQ